MVLICNDRLQIAYHRSLEQFPYFMILEPVVNKSCETIDFDIPVFLQI